MAAAHGWIALIANEANNERIRIIQMRRFYRQLRDISNPFEMPNRRFLNMFRLSKEAVQFLLDTIIPRLPQATRGTAVPDYLKVLCTLHFLGHGSYQSNIGSNANLGMSQPSVSRCVSSVCSIINRILLNNYISFSRNEIAIQRNKHIFFQRYDTLGAIDCTHVAIIIPPREHPIYPAAAFYNRKRFCSINVQIITDASMNIININARYPGSVHDSAIWMMSNVNTYLRNKYLNDNLNYHIIGDEGYPLSPWLMVQYPGDHDNNTAEGRFNNHLRSARSTIERVNGLLKGRFRCLLKHRTLHYNPLKAAKIIYSCAVLHNISRQYNVDMPDDYEEMEVLDDPVPNDDGIPVNNFFLQGSRKRDRITNNFFNRN